MDDGPTRSVRPSLGVHDPDGRGAPTAEIPLELIGDGSERRLVHLERIDQASIAKEPRSPIEAPRGPNEPRNIA